jgi:hypothetical protein
MLVADSWLDVKAHHSMDTHPVCVALQGLDQYSEGEKKDWIFE